MNLIYIVDQGEIPDPEDDAKSREDPNITTPGREANYKPPLSSVFGVVSALNGLGKGTGTTNALALPITSLPIGLLIGAASASPLISQLLIGDKKARTDQLDEAEKTAMAKFFSDHAITPRMAERRGYLFPPGHPQIGKSYKLHPLASLSSSGKRNVYIPQDRYDELLLEEREAELLKLLVELGATKITISEKSSSNGNSAKSASIAGDSKLAPEVKMEGAASLVNNHLDQDTRNFELVGRPWQRGEKLVKEKFAWVEFEPSWGALIAARQIGECTKAAIEIKEETSFSSEKRLAAAIKSKIYSFNTAGQSEDTSKTEKIYFISAEFAPFTSTVKTPQSSA